MFFLAGSAAASALDLISTLQKTLGKTSAPQAPTAQSFDPATLTNASNTLAIPAPAAGGPAPPLAPATMNAMLAVQGQDQGAPVVNGNAFSAQLFSLLDGNNDGAISKSEFETAFGQNGSTTKADSIFAKLDANGDGNVSPDELTNALGGQGQTQGQSQDAQGAHHHHHHGGGMDALANAMSGSSGSASGSGNSNDAQSSSGTSQNVTNSDGSTTTTISYADGSQVTMTIPGAGATGASPAATAHNFMERMIQRQAQMLASSSVGQSFATSV
jgi:hypothetical protein